MDLPMPMITFEISNLKAKVVSAVMDRNKEIDSQISKLVDEAVEKYDFEQSVRLEADVAIHNVVKGAVSELISWELRQEIQNMVRDKILERINKI